MADEKNTQADDATQPAGGSDRGGWRLRTIQPHVSFEVRDGLRVTQEWARFSQKQSEEIIAAARTQSVPVQAEQVKE